MAQRLKLYQIFHCTHLHELTSTLFAGELSVNSLWRYFCRLLALNPQL